MEQIAFLMRLKPGHEPEYAQRHRQIWPELQATLSEAGITDYSIFLDPPTLNLFAILRLRPGNTHEKLAAMPVMRCWWGFMADLMEVDDSHRPIERRLKPMFHMD